MSALGTTAIYACVEPTSMRKGFDALARDVETALKRDPKKGEVFLFVNRRQNYAKVLMWDGEGYIIFAKRLDHGRTFPDMWDPDLNRTKLPLTTEELQTFLGGKRKGYLRLAQSASRFEDAEA